MERSVLAFVGPAREVIFFGGQSSRLLPSPTRRAAARRSPAPHRERSGGRICRRASVGPLLATSESQAVLVYMPRPAPATRCSGRLRSGCWARPLRCSDGSTPPSAHGTNAFRAHRFRSPAESPATSRFRDVRNRCRSEEHTSELQSLRHLVCRLLLEKKKTYTTPAPPRPRGKLPLTSQSPALSG